MGNGLSRRGFSCMRGSFPLIPGPCDGGSEDCGRKVVAELSVRRNGQGRYTMTTRIRMMRETPPPTAPPTIGAVDFRAGEPGPGVDEGEELPEETGGPEDVGDGEIDGFEEVVVRVERLVDELEIVVDDVEGEPRVRVTPCCMYVKH